MANKIYISDLEPGQTVEDEVYCLIQKDFRQTTNGGWYIHAVLADKTGQIPARVWQATEELYKLLPQDGFVRVKGRTENYKGSIQFIIEAVQQVNPADVNMEDFLPVCPKDTEQMFDELKSILRTIKNKFLLYLVKQFILDKDLIDRFKRAPAAIKTHHAYLGGLLEHTLSMMKLVDAICSLYPELDRDIFLVGTFLHDMGKVSELAYDQVFKYTDTGQLIGHLFIGAKLVEEKAKQAEKELEEKFPKELLERIIHMVLSHHGEYEFGSPKLPMTPEAIALHYLDNLDAKLNLVKTQIEKSDQTDPESSWTGYIRSLERPLFKGCAEPKSDSENPEE